MKHASTDFGDLRGTTLQFLQVTARTEHEHTAVPVVIAGLHELAGALDGRLLDEPGNPVQCTIRGPVLDVAVPGFRSSRDDAKRHEAAQLRRRQSGAHGLLKRRDIADDMVRRENEQNRIGGV